MYTLIKNGRIITDGTDYISDILIKDNKILRIDKNIENIYNAEVIDASKCFIFAGFIDTHTHFDLDNGVTKTSDDFKTGTLAALMGGTTCVLDFATQNKGETLPFALSNWHKKADKISSCNYGFHMAITDFNNDVENQMELMSKSGVTSYKLYMAYDNLRLDDVSVYKVIKKAKKLGAIVAVHCENGDLANELSKEQKENGNFSPKAHPKARPDDIEAEAVSRFLYIANLVSAPAYIVHLSTEKGLKEALLARQRGQTVYIETCPQYLLLDESKYDLCGFESGKFMLTPPLRKPRDINALWNAIADGIIDTIGTDHCSFNFKGQKDIGLNDFTKIPNGLPGVKNRAELIYTYGVCEGRITLNRMAELLSEAPSKIFGMDSERGYIKEGKIADIVILNPNVEEVINTKNSFHNVDYTPYEGMAIKGKVRDVILNGKIAVKNYKVVLKEQGEFVFRKGNN